MVEGVSDSTLHCRRGKVVAARAPPTAQARGPPSPLSRGGMKLTPLPSKLRQSEGDAHAMDALTASLIVVAIAAAAIIVAAWITARPRIGVLPAKTDPSSPWAGLPEAAKQFRIFGWVLVMLYYLAALFCLLQGLNDLRVVHHWAQWQAALGAILDPQAEIALYSRFWLALALALGLIGYWTQRRLRRRA